MSFKKSFRLLEEIVGQALAEQERSTRRLLAQIRNESDEELARRDAEWIDKLRGESGAAFKHRTDGLLKMASQIKDRSKREIIIAQVETEKTARINAGLSVSGVEEEEE